MSVSTCFWFFDQQELELIRVDGQLRKLANTGRLDQLLGISPAPVAMQEFDSRLYVNDPANGILVFDLFGTYARTIPIKGVDSFEVRGNALFHFVDGRLFVYDMLSFAITEYPLPADLQGDVLEARVDRGRIFLRTRDRIVIVELGTDH
jgi:hypothetical protein